MCDRWEWLTISTGSMDRTERFLRIRQNHHHAAYSKMGRIQTKPIFTFWSLRSFFGSSHRCLGDMLVFLDKKAIDDRVGECQPWLDKFRILCSIYLACGQVFNKLDYIRSGSSKFTDWSCPWGILGLLPDICITTIYVIFFILPPNTTVT